MRWFTVGLIRSRRLFNRPPSIQLHKAHASKGPPQPFDNMPFSVRNRFVATVFFSLFFGIGLWAPFGILWYSMAKRTL